MGFTFSYWVLAWLHDAGIEPHEVGQALQHSWPRPAVDDATGLVLLVFWGRTRAGRPLAIGTRRVGAWSWDIVAARELTLAEQAVLTRWEEKRSD